MTPGKRVRSNSLMLAWVTNLLNLVQIVLEQNPRLVETHIILLAICFDKCSEIESMTTCPILVTKWRAVECLNEHGNENLVSHILSKKLK